jgi:hypothetical protein
MMFSRRHQPSHTESPPTEVDGIILEMGRTTDQVILNMLLDSREASNRTRQWLSEQRTSDAAWRIAEARKEAERVEKKYPGYREELNRQRASAGLPPV